MKTVEKVFVCKICENQKGSSTIFESEGDVKRHQVEEHNGGGVLGV